MERLQEKSLRSIKLRNNTMDYFYISIIGFICYIALLYYWVNNDNY